MAEIFHGVCMIYAKIWFPLDCEFLSILEWVCLQPLQFRSENFRVQTSGCRFESSGVIWPPWDLTHRLQPKAHPPDAVLDLYHGMLTT
jgi:hypothetical protein